MKRIFSSVFIVGFLLSLGSFSPVAHAYTLLNCADSGYEANCSWIEGDIPVKQWASIHLNYTADPADPSDPAEDPTAEEEAAVEIGFSTWGDDGNADFSYEYMGTNDDHTYSSYNYYCKEDYTTLYTYVSGQPSSETCYYGYRTGALTTMSHYAVTGDTYCYKTASGGYVLGFNKRTKFATSWTDSATGTYYPAGSIIDGAIVICESGYDSSTGKISSALPWHVDPATSPTSGEYDLTSVLAHEAGHVAGLNHSCEYGSTDPECSGGCRSGTSAKTEATMCWSTAAGWTLQRDINSDDQAGLQAIYGAIGLDEDGDGYVTPTDCEDDDARINPAAAETCGDGVDQNCDGVDLNCDSVDQDGDGYTPNGGDCNDADATAHPGGTEVCGNGVDENCSGADLSCNDVDQDGDGYTDNGGDCDDTNPTVSPAAKEICADGINNDCKSQTTDTKSCIYLDSDGDGETAQSDCNDGDASIHAGASEICGDGIDQNCDQSDLNCSDLDEDQDGYTVGEGDCDDGTASIHPGAGETCDDGIDQDCSGSDFDCDDLDEDSDGYTIGEGDCNDRNPKAHPDAAEICDDGQDQDCNGSDLGCGDVDGDGDGVSVSAGDCDDADASVSPLALDELGDGVDSNCDGFGGSTAEEPIQTIAGGGTVDGDDAMSVIFPYSLSVSADGAGNFYVVDITHSRILKVDSDGIASIVAGVGDKGYGGDGGLAKEAYLHYPHAAAVEAKTGVIYIADSFNHRIRKVDANGVITTIAGTGKAGFSGDGGSALSAQLNYPYGIAVGGDGTVYVSDNGNNRVRAIYADGHIATVAGTGTAGYSGDGGKATQAQVNNPWGLAVDSSGTLYISDSGNQRVRKVSSKGIISTVVGTGVAGYSGDGGAATAAQIRYAQNITFDEAGALYISDKGNHCIRKVAGDGTISTIAGTGMAGFSGDGGDAKGAELDGPTGVAVDENGALYIADMGNHRIRRVNQSGVISTVAGSASADQNGAPILDVEFNNPSGVAVSAEGVVYVSDTENHRIVAVDSGNVLYTVAGTGHSDAWKNGDTATETGIAYPREIAFSPSGEITVADASSSRIFAIDSEGVMRTIAGTGTAGFSGDGGIATGAKLNVCYGLAFDADGNLYIADTFNHRVRKVDAGGIITTVAGNGTAGFSGDGGQATGASLNSPVGVSVDSQGNLYIADLYNNRVRRVDTAGMIETVAGNGDYVYNGDGIAATQAAIYYPRDVVVDENLNLYISDANNRVRKVDSEGVISTVVGTGQSAFEGDGAAADQAALHSPGSLAIDGKGTLYIADTYNDRIRQVTP